eukprot:10704534-Alexandrium_andersonii.AAC.1
MAVPRECACLNSWVRTRSRLVNVSSGPKIQPEGAAVPPRPMGQTALSAARNRRNVGDPHSVGPYA